jgi:FAD/FMN-containing dehydrogenase
MGGHIRLADLLTGYWIRRKQTTMMLRNWGNFPSVEAREHIVGPSSAAALLRAEDSLIARGLGRSYGDASLNRQVLSTLSWNRFLDFDAQTGVVVCEAGVSFRDLIDVFLPRGFFPPVTPGTKYVTVGGAIAADVHGKNHHGEGSFGRYLTEVQLLLPSGEVVTCSRDQRHDLFRASLGGMGLTGVILAAGFRMKPVTSAYIVQQTTCCPDLDAVLRAFEDARQATYSVAWLDGLARGRHLGRSVLFRGEHASPTDLSPRHRQNPFVIPHKRPWSMPVFLPGFTLNRFSIGLFNQLYYTRAKLGRQQTVVDYDRFFYPLDHIQNWNRMYGRRGFAQYQFVLPLSAGPDALRDLLQRIAASGQGSFLSVLKLFGPGEADGGLLSFPREGYTLAMDFPINPQTLELMDRLDERVIHYGGRVYLAKDSRMRAEVFRAGYDQAARFTSQKQALDPEGKLASLLSERLEVSK